MEKCKVVRCSNKHYHKGYCMRHYHQMISHGNILKRTIYDPNEIIDCGDYYEICLYNKECKEIARAKIDKDDLEKVKNYKWCFNNCGYVENGQIKSLLHHLIMGKKGGFEIDHKNTNKTDNRKQNLRFVTRSQNSMNKKNVKGYHFNVNDRKYRPYITINYKRIYLGRFANKQDAINARKKAEQKYFGEFAYNN